MVQFVERKMSARELLPLIGIAVSAFVLNTSEFMPVGLLTSIGVTFNTSEAQTGLIVSVYAWAVMILSLPLMVLASRLDFRKLFLGVIALFAVGQVLSALAPSYFTLMGARLVVACAHSVYWAIAAPLAVRVVSPQHQPLALSVVTAGSAIAMIAGLPLGRAIGLIMGWRMAFACVAIVSAVILVYLVIVFPRVSGAEKFGIKQLPVLFRNKPLVGVFILAALYSVGYYTGYSYIEPFLLQVAHMGEDVVTGALCMFGVAGLLGSVLYSKVGHRYRFPFLCAVVAGVALGLLLLRVSSFGLGAVVLVVVVWGTASTGFNIAGQAEVIKATSGKGEGQTVAMAIYSGIINFGIGTGTLLGGAVTNYNTIANVGFVGGVVEVIAVLYCVFALVPLLRGHAPAQR